MTIEEVAKMCRKLQAQILDLRNDRNKLFNERDRLEGRIVELEARPNKYDYMDGLVDVRQTPFLDEAKATRGPGRPRKDAA